MHPRAKNPGSQLLAARARSPAMALKTKPDSTKADTLVSIARDLIRESGDFELSMRDLAARARVSLRTPYLMFGSKAGLVSAVLRADQAIYREKLRALPRGDAFYDLFKSLAAGVAFYAENQAFYRALFRETHAYFQNGQTEPAREFPERFIRTCQRAIHEGLVDPGVDPRWLGETLLDIFSANVRSWAASDYDVQVVESRIGFGWAAVLAGVAPGAHADRMHRRMRDFQATLQDFAPPREVLVGG